MKQPLTFTLNGEERVLYVDTRATLLEAVRDYLGLTGTKEGCGNGNCGACTVWLDGEPAYSCLVLAVEAQGARVMTVEGLAEGGRLDPLQRALIEEGGLQCGFCTPGLLMMARSFLDRHRRPTEREIRGAIAGNLCRCTGYDKIVRAIQRAARGQTPPQAEG
ncbi:MAG: (2Fe-2S)-binding protein [Dehalococcoidia bacterium]|nr:(2Fe-2S)-binding protein [Dehalococcoidia bacterium]